VEYGNKILHKIVATTNCCGYSQNSLQCDLVESMQMGWK